MKIYRPYITDVEQNLIPQASGTLEVGTPSFAWGAGVFDDLQVNVTPVDPLDVANKLYVDTQVGSIVESDTLQIVTDRGAVSTNSITTGGLTVTAGSIAPDASGSLSIGSVALAFDEAYVDKVFLEADPTLPLQAATKQYVDAQSHEDAKVAVDADATAGYLGAASNDGVLRVDSSLDYADGGDYVTVSLDSTLKSNYDAAYSHISANGSSHTYIDQSVTSSATPTFAGIVPDASGTRDLGTIALAFDDAYIDKVYLEANPTTPLQAATKQYVDAAMASATPGGSDTQLQYNDGGTLGGASSLTYNDGTGDVTFGANILVTASGTQDIGTVSLAFNDAYIDKVYLEGDPTVGVQATTKDYVDSLVQGLDWQPSVEGRRGAPVAGPSTGDRYIATATASGWTDNNIYQWSGTGWDETVSNEGFAAWVEDEDLQYTFNGTDWVTFGSTSTHNNLSGLQGGTSSQYYHLTSAQHTIATQAATTDQDGYLTQIDWDTFNDKLDNVSGEDHSSLANKEWSAAGHTIDADVVPTASGTITLGAVDFAYDDAYIDKVYLEADPTTPLQAATKQYVDSQVAGVDAFTDLTDTPANYTDMAASGVRVNSGADGLEFYDATSPRSGHVHSQTGASTSWVVTHNLNNANVIVQVTDGESPENVIIPYNIELTDANTTTITFPDAQSGVARILSLVLA